METTYSVRVWTIQARRNAKGQVTSYRVRWRVGAKPCHEPFKGKAQAESFRADLLSAQRRGIAFSRITGLPVTMMRERAEIDWLTLARAYMDARWPDWSPNHRKHTAYALMEVTTSLLPDKGRPERRILRKAVLLDLNKKVREAERSSELVDAIRWAERNSPEIGVLKDSEVVRSLLQALDLKLDGERASANTVRLRRRALQGAIKLAIERKSLHSNPMDEVQVKKRTQAVRQVDPRSVVNPIQGRMLIQAVEHVGKPGPPLVAFFGCMYYAALRPEEVCGLKKENLSLPEKGFGTIYVERARPEIGEQWSDTGAASEERALKHRDDDEGRSVPCPPELTELLHDHLTRFGTARDGRLFRGARDGGRVSSTTYGRAWAKARAAVFTAEVAAGPLGRRPYDLRHAAVSTWLNGGVEPTRVAKWAGHSVRVLLEVYAKCLDGGEKVARDRVERVLRGW